MTRKAYKVVGVMSGTSLDGLDIACCRFEWIAGRWKSEILAAETIPYPEDMVDSLRKSTSLSGLELTELDHRLGRWMGRQVVQFVAHQAFSPLLVASHGHTVFHQPEKGFTLQIGNGYEIYREAGIPVVCDFRSWDVALGGQGAPLVPVGDRLLFDEYEYCLNLGGIANISYESSGQRMAYDICPANIVLNRLARELGYEYDSGGAIARQGKLNTSLFNQLNALNYYSTPFPKSMGIEWISTHIFPLLEKAVLPAADSLHTFCRHIAHQVSLSCQRGTSGSRLLMTGGGAFNTFLVECIGESVGNGILTVVPDNKIVSYKEALIFAFLGLLRWKGEPNALKSVTGGKKDSSGGIIIDNRVF